MAASSGRMEILTPGENRMGMLGSLLVTLAIVIAIVLVTSIFAARTEGGRAFVADRLGRWVGEEVSIDGARIGWPYALVVDGPATKALAEGKPGFRAQTLRVAFDRRARMCVAVHRGELVLVQDERGEWLPSFWGRLGDLPAKSAGHIERLTAPFRERTDLKITDSSVRWLDQAGNETAYVKGLAFELRSVPVPGRRMSYCRMAAHGLVADWGRDEEVECEWLMSETDPFLRLHGGARGDAAAGGAWFSNGEAYDREEAGAGVD